MKIQNKNIIQLMYLGALSLLLILNGCKKEIKDAVPDDQQSIGLNFYAASDVLRTIGKGIVPVFIDKYEPGRIIGSSNAAYPFFDYNIQAPKLDYPVIYGSNAGLYYVRFNAGTHRYMFTDTARNITVDTTMTFPEKSYQCFYLSDAATADNAPAKYMISAITEPRSVPEGKVGVRFVHLSADAGELTCNFQKADGSLSNSLPAALKFGEASAYQYYDHNEVSANNLLRFSLINTNTGAFIPTGVSFNPGRSYVVVITGFLKDQRRQIAIGKNADGSVKYTSVTIGKNLRAEIRTSY
jgi:hypothetical protein